MISTQEGQTRVRAYMVMQWAPRKRQINEWGLLDTYATYFLIARLRLATSDRGQVFT